jgi:hypothetical protein
VRKGGRRRGEGNGNHRPRLGFSGAADHHWATATEPTLFLLHHQINKHEQDNTLRLGDDAVPPPGTHGLSESCRVPRGRTGTVRREWPDDTRSVRANSTRPGCRARRSPQRSACHSGRRRCGCGRSSGISAPANGATRRAKPKPFWFSESASTASATACPIHAPNARKRPLGAVRADAHGSGPEASNHRGLRDFGPNGSGQSA